MTERDERPRLALLCSYSGDGGVERVVNLLAEAFAEHVDVDLLTLKCRGRHAEAIPPTVKHIPLTSQHAATADVPLAHYLRERNPAVLLVAKDRAGRAALRARRRAEVTTPVWLQLHTSLSASLLRRSKLSRWWRLRPMRRDYPQADGIVCVSQGVADDLVAQLGLDAAKVHVIHNPVLSARAEALADAPVDHPWLTVDRSVPVLMGMGRLTAQKDFPTLLRAFAQLRRRREVRLLIVGDGVARPALHTLARDLGIAADVGFPGYQANPYAWLARADAFVLSSRWEGFGMTLAEALSLGISCVSTDCPSGPREILEDGRLGKLVPPGDESAMADAMAAALDAPPDPQMLREAGRQFRADTVGLQYLRLLGLLAPVTGA